MNIIAAIPTTNDSHQGLNTQSQLISVKPITFNTINIMTKTVVQDTPTPTILSVLFIILFFQLQSLLSIRSLRLMRKTDIFHCLVFAVFFYLDP